MSLDVCDLHACGVVLCLAICFVHQALCVLQVAARNAALNVAGGVKVDVFVRVRPHLHEDGDCPDVVEAEGNEILMKGMQQQPHLDLEQSSRLQHPMFADRDRTTDVFKFDRVFSPSCSNEELFGTAMQAIVEQVGRGLSSCVFAYGQTGSGKTYTMRGTLDELDNPSQYGLIQRSVDYLMQFIRKVRKRISIACHPHNAQLIISAVVCRLIQK
jgi:chromosomal replication initiation ATPase DnaA